MAALQSAPEGTWAFGRLGLGKLHVTFGVVGQATWRSSISVGRPKARVAKRAAAKVAVVNCILADDRWAQEIEISFLWIDD